MMSNPIRVLILEDRATDAELMMHELQLCGFALDSQRVETEAEYLAVLETKPDLILADWSLPQFSGRRALGLMKKHDLDIPFIIVSGSIGEEVAIEAMRQGASDYVLKDRPARLGQAVQHALEDKQIREERRRAEEALRASEQKFRSFVAQSEDAAVLNDEKGAIVEWNRGAERIFGQQRADVLGRFLWDVQFQVVPPERKTPQAYEQLKISIIDALKTGRSSWLNRLGEVTIQRLDGIFLTIQTMAFPIQTKDGFMLGSISRDITERKQAEEALARQTQELRERNEELDRLYRASGSLLSSTPFNLQSLAKTIVEVVLREFGYAICSLITVQKDSNELVRLAVGGSYADQVINRKLTLDGPGLVPQAISTGMVIHSDDVRLIPGFISNWDAARSELTIPLKVGNNVNGVIDIQSSELGAFTLNDERLMSIFAERAALALERGRLNDELERRLLQLTSLRTIDTAIASSMDVNLTLSILLDQLPQHLRVDAADVLLFEPILQTFKYAVERGFRTHGHMNTTLRLGEGIASRVLRERQIVVIQNVESYLSELQKSEKSYSEDFVTYVGAPLIAKGQIKGVLEIFAREPIELDKEQRTFLEMVAGAAAIAIESAQLFENLQGSNSELMMAYDETIEGWSRAMDLRDKETEGHTQRVTELTLRLASSIGSRDEELVHLRRGALLHDIGKMGVPDEILHKPGALTDEEWVVMRKHPQFAYDMLAPIVYLRPAIDIPYCHHEKWDGTGYPRGLKGEQIPLAARIFAVVDVWDALCSDRPYRKAWPEDKVRSYIQEQAGKHFDPHIVEVFLKEVSNVG